MKKVNQFWRERSETRNKIIEKSASVFPFCRYKEFKKMPQTNFDIVKYFFLIYIYIYLAIL